MDINRRSYKSLIKTLKDTYEIIDSCAEGNLLVNYEWYRDIDIFSDDVINKAVTLKTIKKVYKMFENELKMEEKEEGRALK